MDDKLGISQSAYPKIETEVSHEQLNQIAKILELATKTFLAFDEKYCLILSVLLWLAVIITSQYCN